MGQGELARAGGRPPRQPGQEHQEVRPVVDSDLSRANLVSCSSSTVGTATVGTATVGIATVGTAPVGTATVGTATVGNSHSRYSHSALPVCIKKDIVKAEK